MLGFIGIIAVIILSIRVSRLSKDLELIKKQLVSTDLSTVTIEPNSEVIYTPGTQSIPTSTISPEKIQYQSVTSNTETTNLEPDVFSIFFDWFKENWLLKVGVLLILVGFGWFISYAFVHQWIGPVGRVILGFATGTILALYGTFRLEKHATQGKLFLVLGSALILVTSYAARTVYGYFTPVMSLTFVFLVSAYISVVALQFKMKNLALYGLACAYITPILIHSLIDTKLLFMYLVVVSLSTIWMTSVEGWKEINIAGLLGFALFAVPYIFGINSLSSADEIFVLCTIFALAFLYFIVSIIGVVRDKDTQEEGDGVLAVGVLMLVIFTTLFLVSKEFQSIILMIWFCIFAAGSLGVFSYTKKIKFFYIYSLIAVIFLGIVTAIELEGIVLVYAFAFEAAIISIAGYLITRKLDAGYSLSMLMIIPVLLSFESFVSSSWSKSVLHDDFGVLSVMGLLLVGLGIFYYFAEQKADSYNDVSNPKMYPGLIVGGTLYFLALIWLVPGAVFVNDGAAVLTSLVIYTIIGIFAYFTGLFQKIELLKYYGGILLLAVVLRLVLIDVWDMALAERIVTFISIGVLFISTAFIGKNIKS